jgi:hypothetical protein
MFRENVEHLQKDMFGLFHSMPKGMQKKASASEEHDFYKLMYCQVDEQLFEPLYSDVGSRPNAAINGMVSAMVLMHKRHWTYEELFNNLQFNLLTRLALGLDDVESMPFCMATLFNFQNRLLAHYVKTGEDLIECIFDGLTAQQLKTLGLDTTIQRTDSFLAESNIRDYTRVQLLVEVIIRFYRTLSDEDKQLYHDHFADYLQGSSGQYIYRLQRSEVPHELEKLAKLYQWIVKKFRSAYKDTEIYQTLKRVYHQHFTVIKRKVYVKPAEDLTSDSVQSPDDVEATYREKNGEHHHGRVINVVETAHPANEVNLITDVAVNENNIDDSKVLHKRIDQLKAKTPELNEMHLDGGYGSIDNDRAFAKHQITPVQTAVRGRKSAVRFDMEQIDDHTYLVQCPGQQAKSAWLRKRFKVCFELDQCSQCPHQRQCPAQKRKSSRTLYFNHDDYLRIRRINSIEKLPEDRRALRNNVEATVNEFKCRTKSGHLKVRGTFKTRIFAFSTAMAINFGRIYRYGLQSA